MIEFPVSPGSSVDWQDDDWAPPGWSEEQVEAESREAAEWFTSLNSKGRR